jgi:Mrp family chromosome partitioning ATPase/capsular polysaccharide biosynthesis protein
MSTTSPSLTESDPLALLRPVLRRKWLLLAIVVASTAGTYFLSARSPALYRSSTQVLVLSSKVATIVSAGQDALGGSDRNSADQATLLLSKAVSEAVIKQLHLQTTPEALASEVTAAPVVGSDFVTVSVVDTSPARAAAVANAYVQQYLKVSNDQLVQQATAAIARLQGQIAVTGPKSAQRAYLQGLVHQLQVLEAAGPSARQGNPAQPSGIPISPRPKRDAVFGFAISLALGVALAFALERLDPRIKDVDDVSKLYGLPLLSIVPHAASPAEVQEGLAAVPEELREPFRTLRTSMQLTSLDWPIKRIAVASGVSGEGKSLVVRNLALTYREFGFDVVVVEADVRRPTLSGSFGVEAGAGLTTLLTGGCELSQALVQVDSASVDYLVRLRVEGAPEEPRAGVASATSSGRLMLLASGSTPPNPQAVLASERMRQVIQQLSDQFDIVLIDTPPLLVVSDALPLLAQCDAVILVSRVGKTKRQEAEKATASAQLDPRVRVLGVVANDVAANSDKYYGYK